MSINKLSNIINDTNMYKLSYYDNTLQPKIDKIKYALISFIGWYNNNKKTHVNEIKLTKVEYKYDRLFRIYDYKIVFVTDGNKMLNLIQWELLFIIKKNLEFLV